jgi:hypothetical protein
VTGGCPSCGVAVIPGYVKCPRCHAVLPGAASLRRSGLEPGGTSVPERSFPIAPVAVGAIAVALVLFFVLGGDRRKAPPAGGASAPDVSASVGEAVAPIGPAGAAPAPRPLEIPAATGPNPGTAAAELERALGRQRLWSSVQPSGDRVDVRSGSCAEPAIGPVIDAARAALRGAGLTRLRCLAQSGAVVFERDL